MFRARFVRIKTRTGARHEQTAFHDRQWKLLVNASDSVDDRSVHRVEQISAARLSQTATPRLKRSPAAACAWKTEILKTSRCTLPDFQVSRSPALQASIGVRIDRTSGAEDGAAGALGIWESGNLTPSAQFSGFEFAKVPACRAPWLDAHRLRGNKKKGRCHGRPQRLVASMISRRFRQLDDFD